MTTAEQAAANPRALTAEEVTAELERLDKRTAALKTLYASKRDEVNGAWKVGRDAVQPLADVYRPFTRFPDAVPYDEARAATLALVQRILNEDLLLAPVDPLRPTVGVTVVDPLPRRELAEVSRLSAEHQQERAAFATRHAQLLADADARAKVDEVRRQLDGSDPDALRDAIADLGTPSPRSTLTSRDVVHRR